MQKIAPYTQLESCKCIITVACHVVILRYTFAAGNGHPTLLESLYISTFVHVYGVYIYNKCISVYLHYSLYFYLDYSFLCILYLYIYIYIDIILIVFLYVYFS